jgi:translation initiation factor IF-2
LARRIFEIAKDLGVDSKAIVKKCHDEGIPEATVKNHMSSISAGLEATIKEWFTQHDTSGGTATAVEQAEKVDLEKVKVKAPRKRKAGAKDGSDIVAPPASLTEVAVPVETPPEVPEEAAPKKAKKVEPTVIAPPVVAPVTPVAPEPVAPVAPAPVPAAAPEIKPVHVEPRPLEAAAKAPEGPSGGAAVVEPPKRPEPPARPKHVPPVKPAPMNVPVRPTSIAPAGPKLESRAPVKLSGPKVVRVEAPEVIQAPRPRRVGPPMGPGPGGPRTGGGAGPTTAGGDDDRGRSPRRKEGAGAAANKRSSGQGVPDRRRGRSGAEWDGPTAGIFSEQDLIEREARLARAGGFLKKRKQDLKKPGQPQPGASPEAEGKVQITAPFTIKELSAATGVKGADIVKKLFLQGVMATINSSIAPEKAIEIMMEFDIDLEVTEAKTAEETVSEQFVNREVKDQRHRGPVVTILGHVDHGKTSLLDKIRNTNVAAGEAGGITQKTSAFVAEIEVEGSKRQVVFLDTPGHEAFTSMRARGAKMTDVVVLVVSAPEGVMPQTVESINHAKAAKVPIVVALNKIDRPDATEAQVQKTLGELAKAGLNPVEWGGDIEVVRTSATTGQGIKQLLEVLDYQSQLLDLKADFDGPAQGTVIEAKMEEGRGAVANILIQQGKLEVGDFIVMGRAFGRIRDITDDKGKRVKEAMPPMPVQVSGIDEVCDAGDKFFVTETLRQAEEAADQRRQRERHVQLAAPKLTLDTLFSQMQTTGGEPAAKEIRIILKTDQQGTVDVLKGECEKIKTDEVKTRVIHAAVGGITESDVLLGDASKAIIIGFNVIPSGKARQLAELKGVEIRTYQVIYDITDDLKKAAEGLLAPEVREEVLGHADVRKVFKVSKVGNVAGCYVTDGTVQRDALIRVTRQGVVIEHDRKLSQLKRVKEDAKEVRAGLECGMKIDGYDDIKEGDVLECYKKTEVKRTLGALEGAGAKK